MVPVLVSPRVNCFKASKDKDELLITGLDFDEIGRFEIFGSFTEIDVLKPIRLWLLYKRWFRMPKMSEELIAKRLTFLPTASLYHKYPIQLVRAKGVRLG